LHAVYLLREDFSLTVTLITQGELVDVITLAVILLDAGCGENSSNQKAYSY
jgi:hypothetical protein